MATTAALADRNASTDLAGDIIASTRGRGAFRRLLSLLKVEPGLLVLVGIFQFLQAATYVPFRFGLKILIDDILPMKQVWPIVIFAIVNFLWWLPHSWSTIRAYVYNQRLIRGAIGRLRRLVVDKLQRMSLHFFSARGSGALSNQLTVDMSKVEGLLNSVASNFLMNITLGVCSVACLLWMNPLLSGIVLGIVACQLTLVRLLRRHLDTMYKRVQKSGEHFSTKMVEFISGMRVTRSFGNEDMALDRMQDSIERMRTDGLEASVAMRWVSMSVQVSSEFMVTIVWCVGGYLMLQDKAKIGELIAFTAMVGFIQVAVNQTIGAFEAWVSSKPGLDALLSILDNNELEEYDAPAKQEVRLTGDIVFDRVSFAYPPGTTPALSEIDLRVPAGQRIGLVGETGAGKSTFLDLILGFYVPTSGTIRYDGHELAAIGRRQLRRATGIMGQDAFIWNDTVLENIRFGRPSATSEEIREAAVRAQADSFINQLDGGYQYVCGERGSKLSGGQRQRLALARVFLRNPSMLILDEPTSALDLETEAKLQVDLDRLCRGRTTFIVAHRLSTLRDVERILVFDHGRIIEDGSPGELLAKTGGQFAKLYALQGQGLFQE